MKNKIICENQYIYIYNINNKQQHLEKKHTIILQLYLYLTSLNFFMNVLTY